MWKRWSEIKLWKRVAGGLVLGIIVGLLIPDLGVGVKPIGDLFIRFIKLLVVPLVFLSLVVGVTSLKDPVKMGRIGLKTIVLYLVTTALAVSIGLLLAVIVQPGAGVEKVAGAAAQAKNMPSVTDTILGLVPTNPVQALAEGNILQIIVFAILTGLALNFIGAKSEPMERVISSGAEMMYKMTAGVMELAPFGVFALMAWVAGKYGVAILLPLGKVILTVYVGCILHVLIVYSGLLKAVGLRLKPWYKGIVDAQMVAFTTTSSSGTLPVTIRCAEENLGVKRGIASFVLPLGATINMDGTALYQAVSALFIAQVFGVELSGGAYLTIILTATLASIGTAGVPGAGLIMLSLVLTSVGLPMEGLAIVAGIDRILDMARTTVNVTGDTMVAALVAKSEGELDEAIYNAERSVA